MKALRGSFYLYFTLASLLLPAVSAAQTRLDTTAVNQLILQQRAQSRETSTKMLQALRSKEIVGLELIVAGPGVTSVQSRWGHALLRFVDTDGDDFNDVVVGFVADVTDATPSKLKGLLGGYKATVEITTMSQYINFYNTQQGRSLGRFVLASDPKLVQALIHSIEHFMNDAAFAGNYYFSNRNCASLLEEILMNAGFPTLSFKGKTPINLGEHLQKEALATLPVVPMVDLQRVKSTFLNQLGLAPTTDLRKLELKNFLEKQRSIDDETLLKAYYLMKEQVSLDFADEMFNELIRRHLRVDLNKIFQILPLPRALYKLCDSSECMDTIASEAVKTWPRQTWEPHCRNIAPFWDSAFVFQDFQPNDRRFRKQALELRGRLCQ